MQTYSCLFTMCVVQTLDFSCHKKRIYLMHKTVCVHSYCTCRLNLSLSSDIYLHTFSGNCYFTSRCQPFPYLNACILNIVLKFVYIGTAVCNNFFILHVSTDKCSCFLLSLKLYMNTNLTNLKLFQRKARGLKFQRAVFNFRYKINASFQYCLV